jgi:hypothetical protein
LQGNLRVVQKELDVNATVVFRFTKPFHPKAVPIGHHSMGGCVLLSLVLIPSFFSSVSYDLTGGFASLIITNIPMLQEISLAVASAILIDVTVVILFFVPALMGLAQKLNWWPYKLSRSKKPENNTN